MTYYFLTQEQLRLQRGQSQRVALSNCTNTVVESTSKVAKGLSVKATSSRRRLSSDNIVFDSQQERMSRIEERRKRIQERAGTSICDSSKSTSVAHNDENTAVNLVVIRYCIDPSLKKEERPTLGKAALAIDKCHEGASEKSEKCLTLDVDESGCTLDVQIHKGQRRLVSPDVNKSTPRTPRTPKIELHEINRGSNNTERRAAEIGVQSRHGWQSSSPSPMRPGEDCWVASLEPDPIEAPDVIKSSSKLQGKKATPPVTPPIGEVRRMARSPAPRSSLSAAVQSESGTNDDLIELHTELRWVLGGLLTQSGFCWLNPGQSSEHSRKI